MKSEQEFEFEERDPHKLVYRIRDGLNVAESLPSSPYTGLKKKWRLRARRDTVVAELKDAPVEVASIQLLRRKLTVMTIHEVNGVLEVIGAAIKHKSPRLEFPDAHITGNGILNLERWCNANSYQITQFDPYLILTKSDNDKKDSGVEHGGSDLV